MKHLLKNDNRIRKGSNAGFTLVEMIVVLTIMAVMMGGAVWGVTGWIAHYEYVSSEEKARTIYMAAQSALSAAESRGTIDEYMDSFNSSIVKFATNDGDAGLDKAACGIPTNPDNEGKIHEYGYLVVDHGDYTAHPEKALFKMIEPYVSDSEQLNASIVVEFDLTAKKIYAAFYSNWCTSLEYGDETCVERGKFYINVDRREPEFRQNYQVGYYGADQVNVVKLDNLPQLNVDCMLHNEETLYLTMNSTDDNAEELVDYTVSLYEDPNPITSSGGFFGMFGDPDAGSGSGSNDGLDNGASDGNDDGDTSKKLLCSIKFDKSKLAYSNTDNNIPKRVELEVFDDMGVSLGKYWFILSFNKYQDDDGKDQEEFVLILDATATRQSIATLDDKYTVDKRTASGSYSITRLIGADPKNICAKVSVEPTVAGMYSSGSYKISNTENALFETKKEKYKDNKYYNNNSAYLIRNNRHFANIDYTERYFATEDKGCTYALVNDIDYMDAAIYDIIKDSGSGDSAINPVDMSVKPAAFSMISKLNTSSHIDGDGNQYSNLVIDNSSGINYVRNNGEVVNDPATGKPANIGKTLGIVGINKGKIGRLIISNANVKALSYEEYSNQPEASGISEATKRAVYNDKLEAVGLLCGRNEGSLREIYFDNKCLVNATVFANLDDVAEAEADGLANAATDKYLNEKYGCGIGMLAGTVVLDENTVIDRIRTAGEVKASVKGDDDNFREAPAVSDSAARAEIYNDQANTGETKSNAQYYAYGVGGTFGYVYGKFDNSLQSLGIGVSENDVHTNNSLHEGDAGYYLPMYNRVENKTTVPDENGDPKEVITIVKGDKLLFDNTDDRSIVNKADITVDSSFAGGIVGNIFISGLSDNMKNETDSDEDITIPAAALKQLTNCHNYGDTTGIDFVGGVVGINGTGGYIAECSSYGSPSATKGVSAGITSENYGYIKDCLVDRAEADEDNTNSSNEEEPYIPVVKGNMIVAGAITSVNHDACVVKDCRCAIADIKDTDSNSIVTPIKITGNEMDTFGYLVGENFGVVDGGKSGEYIGYESKKKKITIGGAVGTNNSVVKKVTVTAKLEDKGEAECIGGVVGLNLDTVKFCKFGGDINKSKSSTEVTVGGIAGRNGNGSNLAKINGCYLIGAHFDVTGACNFVETDTADAKIKKSSAVGGICGVNYANAAVSQCYITGLGKVDNNNKAKTLEVNGISVSEVDRQSKIQVKDGMTGGVAAVNYGSITECGYTDKVFFEKDDEFVCSDDTQDSKKDSYKVGDNMSLFASAKKHLADIDGDDEDSREAVDKLSELLMDTDGNMTSASKKLCGYLSDDKSKYQYALPKYAMDDENDGTHWDAYNADTNQFIISMGYKKNGNDVKGKGCIGGIVGFNTESGEVSSCATGRWLVENYMPKVTYDATGGVIGNNAADDDYVKNLINFAYVRIELPIVYKNNTTMNLNNGQAQNNSTAPDNRFYYVGGVVGTQYNKTKTNWSVERCVNVGTIVNYYGHNTGGILGQACGMGGDVQYCYNYGMTMTGYSTAKNGSKSGTAGGIVSHYTNLEPGQVSQVVHCNNYGIISFPMQGLDFDTAQVKDIRGNAAANDVGGIVGEISAPLSTSLYTVNIIDCVNAKCSKVYSYSKCAGIIGQIGCLTKDNVNTDYAVNSLFVNVDTCRNYCSDFWTSYSEGRQVGTLFSMTGGGITAGRDQFDPNTNESTWTGYTTIRNCFSVRMNGDYNYNVTGSQYSASNYTNNYNNKKNNGIIAFSKIYDPVNQGKSTPRYRVFKYCGNNYYLDESSFQYTDKNGLLLKSGYNRTATKADSGFDGDVCKVNATIATSEPADDSKKYATYKANFKDALINKVNDLSLYLDDYNKSRLASERIISVSYFVGDVEKYALFVEPKGVVSSTLNTANTWINEGEDLIYIKTSNGTVSTNVLYSGLSEHNSSAPYDKRLTDHFFFNRIKNIASYRSQASDEIGENLDNKVDSTRLPILDEYDIDYFDLDNKFMSFIDKYQAKGPDTVYDVNVSESDNNEYYEVTWKIKSNDENSPSATKFDVMIYYIRLDEDNFDSAKVEEYIANNSVTDYKGYTGKPENVYGTKTIFNVPDDLIDDDGYYYAIVKVRDSRDEDGPYSIVENREAVVDAETNEIITPAVKSFKLLKRKMPTPEFEIVKYTVKNKNNVYESKWMLHLTNPDDFKSYASLPGFEIGAYQLNNDNTPNMTKAVKLTTDKIIDGSGNVIQSNLLNNAVEIGNNFTTNKVDHKLYGYAKADGYLDADKFNFSVYIPSIVEPSMNYTLDPADEDMLNNSDKKPEYSGTLTYNAFNGTTIPPVEQVFRVELYGVKTAEVNGTTKKWHETVAYKEYPLAVGEDVEVNIGYYDVPSSVNLSEYDSFGIDYWYSAPGDGYRVYNYFEITDEWKTIANADRTVRSSGYIKDLSSGTEKNYFHTTKLPTPKFMPICMERKRSDTYATSISLNDSGQSPEWYLVLTNADEYPAGTQIVMGSENNVVIDFSNYSGSGNTALDKLFEYALPIQTGWSNNQFWAKSEGSISSDKAKISPNNKNTTLYRENNLRNNLNVNLGVDTETYTDDDGNEGCFTLSADNKLTFRGTIQYNSQGNADTNTGISQYYRYEIYAYNKVSKQIETIYLSPDCEMKKGSAASGYKYSDNVEVVIPDDSKSVKVEDYEDFHFAVWYSKSAINSEESDKDVFAYHYTEISESVAKSFDCYNTDADAFENARGNGILIDVSKIDPDNDITKPTYYYVTSLADKTYGDTTYTSNYTKYVLYRELYDTVTTIQKNDDGTDKLWVEGDTIKYVKWLMNPTYYSDADVGDVECDVKVKVYEYPADASAPTLSTLDESKLAYEDTVKNVVSPLRLDESDDYTYDWKNYKYYAIVKVKDSSMLSEDAYSNYCEPFEMAKPLPMPKVSYVALGNDGNYLRLDNYSDYVDCTGKVEVVITLGAFPGTTYVIDVNGGSYQWQKTTSGVPIAYTAKDKMSKHYITNGATFKLEAYAREKDPLNNDEIVNTSARNFIKTVYIPTGGNVAPHKTIITLDNSDVSVNYDKTTVTFTSDIGFGCDSGYAPKDEQGFTVALVGTPNTNVLGSTKPVILSRTTDQGLMLSAGETKTNVKFTFDLAPDVDLDDFKDLYVYIWYSYFGSDGCVHPEVKLTNEEFEQYKAKDGVVVDLTNGIDNAEYYYERVFGNKNELPSETSSTDSRGSIKYKVNLE